METFEDTVKEDQLYDLNFDALRQNGLSTPDINQALVRFKTYDDATKAGITDPSELKTRINQAVSNFNELISTGEVTHDQFLYSLTNVAPKAAPLTRFTQFALQGATEAAFQIGTGIAGAKTASKLPLPPQAKPAAAGLGFVGGMLLGDIPAQKAVETGQSLGIFEGRPLFPENNVFAEMGKVAGYDALVVAASPYLLPRKAYNTFSGYFISQNLLKKSGPLASIARAPYRTSRALETGLEKAGAAARGELGKGTRAGFFAGETAATLAATSGAGIAESYDPGDASTSAGFQVAGGVAAGLTPTSLLIKFMPRIISGAQKVTGREAQEGRVANRIARLIQARAPGESVESILQSLEKNPEQLSALAKELLGDESLVPELTPAQISGSPFLARLQQDTEKVATQTNSFSLLDKALQERNREGYDFAIRLIGALEASGDPSDFKLATEIRIATDASLLEQQFLLANAKAVAAADTLNISENARPEVISRNLYKNLRQLNANAKAQETALYDEVDGTIAVDDVRYIQGAIDNIRESYVLRSGTLPPAVENELRSFERALGLQIVEVSEPTSLTRARKALQDIPRGDVAEYDAFVNRFFIKDEGSAGGLRPNTEALRIYAPDVDVSDLGKGQTPDDIILEIMADRRRRNLSDSRFKRFERINKAKGNLAQEEASYASVEKTALQDVQEPELVFNDLKKFRSFLLNEAANAYGGDNPNKALAAALGELADAVGSDMDNNIAAAGGSVAYERAKAFSLARNQSIVRTFAGATELKLPNRGRMIHPDLLIEEVLQGGSGPTALRIAEMLDAASTVKNLIEELDVPEDVVVPRGGILDQPRTTGQTIDGEPEVVDLAPVPIQDIESSLEQVFRYAARKILRRDENGDLKVDPTKAKDFLEDGANQRLFEMFPQVRDMITTGDQLTVAAKLAETEAGKAALDKRLQEGDAIANVINYDNPSTAIAEAIEGKKPYTEIENLVKLVSSATSDKELLASLGEGITGSDVTNGFKSAIIKAMWVRNGGTSASPNFAQMKEYIFGPLESAPPKSAFKRPAGAGKPGRFTSLADILKDQDIFSQAELDRLEYIIDAGRNIQVAEAGGKNAGKLVKETDDILSAMVRWLGAGAAGRAGEIVPLVRPQGLVEAGLGAKLAGKLFERVPAKFQIALLEKAVYDAPTMVALLQKADTPEAAKKAIARMRGFLINAGLTLAEDDIPEEVETYFDQRIVEDQQIMTRDPSIPSTPDQPFGFDLSMAPAPPAVPMPAPQTTSASPVSLAQAPPQPDTRRRMAAAFPGDGIMGLMGTG